MPLSRVRRVSLAHSVSSQLSRAIVAGDFPAGAQLSEPSLATKLGVSRAPVREALIELGGGLQAAASHDLHRLQLYRVVHGISDAAHAKILGDIGIDAAEWTAALARAS